MNSRLSNPDLLILEEQCLVAEERCDQRAAKATACGDHRTASFEMQLKEQYRNLRRRMAERRDYSGRPEGISPDSLEAVALRRTGDFEGDSLR